jgi:predicted nucleic acid-binding protein
VIVVDTSVWIAARRKPGGSEITTLQQLIDADEALLALPVRIELLAGTSRRERQPFRRALAALPVAHPVEETWRLVESWIGRAADAGRSFSIPDLLIAALADERGALVWSLDSDFEQMEKLKLVSLYGQARGKSG